MRHKLLGKSENGQILTMRAAVVAVVRIERGRYTRRIAAEGAAKEAFLAADGSRFDERTAGDEQISDFQQAVSCCMPLLHSIR